MARTLAAIVVVVLWVGASSAWAEPTVRPSGPALVLKVRPGAAEVRFGGARVAHAVGSCTAEGHRAPVESGTLLELAAHASRLRRGRVYVRRARDVPEEALAMLRAMLERRGQWGGTSVEPEAGRLECVPRLGTRTATVVRRWPAPFAEAARARLSEAQTCVGHRRPQRLVGRAVVALRADPEGRVVASEVRLDALRPDVTRCFARWLSRIAFPGSPDGAHSVVRMPIELTPAGLRVGGRALYARPSSIRLAMETGDERFAAGKCVGKGRRRPVSDKGFAAVLDAVARAEGPIDAIVSADLSPARRARVREALAGRGALHVVPATGPEACSDGLKKWPPPVPPPEGTTRTSTVIRPSLHKEEVRQVIQRALPRFKRCYESALSRDANLAGTVALYSLIQPDGRVREAIIATNTVSAAVGRCVRAEMMRLEFPPPRGGGVVVITYPFVFASK